MPKRIQLSRAKGWRKPAGAIVVSRPSRWGNPLRIGQWKDYGAADAVHDFREWLLRNPAYWSYDNAFGAPPALETIRRELGGRDLCCWCPLGQPCHVDVLLELANAPVAPHHEKIARLCAEIGAQMDRP